MNKTPRILSLVALALLATPCTANAQTRQYSKNEALCRDGLFSPAYQLTSVLLSEAGHCHRLRMLGKIDAATECSNYLNAPRSNRIVNLENHLRNRSVARCADVGTTTSMGYPASCPPPCASVAITDFSGVAECSICLARNAANRMVVDSIGTPPVSGPSDELDCQQDISTALAFGTRRRMREQRVCQKIQDVGKTVSGVTDNTDCEDADLLGKVAKAEARARGLIARCGAGVVANLDSCSVTSITAVQDCVENAIQRSVGEIYTFVYPNRTNPAPLQAFVTDEDADGSDIAGVANASVKCQDFALTAGLTGTFRAWLSSHNAGVVTSSPSTTFVHGGRSYERIDGVAIATSFTDLTDGNLLVPLNVSELGAVVDVAFQDVWTGTNTDGSPNMTTGVSADDNCNQWSGGAITGLTGRAFSTDATWTANATLPCNSSLRLYCFEQAP